jgi:glutamyl-tRNA(Gln) amidotransferase subunit E
MGIVMKELRGKASGEIINRLLLKNIKSKLEKIG